MAMYYDGSGRMRERKWSVQHGLRTTGVVLKLIALVAVVISLPVWGRMIPHKAH